MCFSIVWRVLAPMGGGRVITEKWPRQLVHNLKAIYGPIRPNITSNWILVVSSHEKSGTNINLIIAPTNPRIIGGSGTTCGFGNDLEENTNLSRKIDEAMDLRASLRDMCKKRRTDMGLINMVISSEEKADSRRLE
ncbi:hypothetical protein J1N35_025369 [Gossypium stocksii]|uniref:Uncharacterized protein n=1 Tax=Gossypium stocksii TaxID=47602 RepID=A0A9D3V7F6_9ROSI|nr:hypothetical protein J1N35_025369 [Gossypium stocksii]